MIFSINATQAYAPLQLCKGSALTFRPAQAGVLRVTSGRVWATLNPQDTRDLVVTSGTELSLRAGQAVVMEAWPVGDASASALVWEPVCTRSAVGGWGRALLQRLSERGLPVLFHRHHSVCRSGSAPG